jgi:hypothetical protein
VPVEDKSAAVETVSREKATSDPGSVGAPMSGVVVEVRVKEGQEVKKGDIICGELYDNSVITRLGLLTPAVRSFSAKCNEDGKRGFRASLWTHQTCLGERGRLVEPRRSSCRNCTLNWIELCIIVGIDRRNIRNCSGSLLICLLRRVSLPFDCPSHPHQVFNGLVM